MQQKQALEVMKLGHNVYLTGEAGTGKTYVLNKYREFLEKKTIPVAVTASTGIAATHLNGTTIDSWSGLGILDDITDQQIRALSHKHHLKKRLLTTKVLLIDEVSMIQGRRFDAYNRILKLMRGSTLPFGGIQVILCGDLFQLPPVTRSGPIDYIFKSHAWKELYLHICYLTVPKRQSEPEFLKVLSDIRHNTVNATTHEVLLQTQQRTRVHDKATKLYTHNVDVDEINSQELGKINSDEHRFYMTAVGPTQITDAMKRSCLAPETLLLKKGALVMFVRNNFEQGYFNGTLGQVAGFTRDGRPIVKTFSGRKIEVHTAEWTISEENKTVAQITQTPLRLAWAITVHKSQGMTLDAAEIDLSKSFVEGMGYVALSRVKSLKNIKLLGINAMALRVNPEVTAIDAELMRQSEEITIRLGQTSTLQKWLAKRKFMYQLTST